MTTPRPSGASDVSTPGTASGSSAPRTPRTPGPPSEIEQARGGIPLSNFDGLRESSSSSGPKSPSPPVMSSRTGRGGILPHYFDAAAPIGHSSDNSEEQDTDLEKLIDELESSDGRSIAVSERSLTDAPYIGLQYTNTDTRTGLDGDEVLRRVVIFGRNKLTEHEDSFLKVFFNYLIGPIQFVMEAAALLAAGLEDWIDFGIILGLLFLNALVGAIQEHWAGNTVRALKKTIAPRAIVLRDSKAMELHAEQLVPGDVVKLDEGTILPADGKIITADALILVDQSTLTGESLAVNKTTNDTCYQSSTVRRGEGYMIVTHTGDRTLPGRLATLTKPDGSKGHFALVLNGIGTTLLVFVIVTLLVVWISSFYRNNDIVTILQFSLGITIIGVPVGLPLVVTSTMAVGAAYLAKKKAIVRKLAAIESLAGCEVLCSDKTGTLTKNQLSIAQPFALPGVDIEDLILTACLAASHKASGLDAIDKAFLKALSKYPQARREIHQYRTVQFSPFDPVSRKVTTVVESRVGERFTCIKGAALAILSTVKADNDIPDAIDQAYKNTVAEFATKSYRALGVARRRDHEPWELLGVVPLMDPPRHDTAKAMREAQSLGLSIKMLTGDGVGIARETARRLGLGTNIFNSDRLGIAGGGDLPGSTIHDYVEAADGFAEVFPQHKFNVVDILQQRGHLVAMTGDGVNDAPSLKRADAGIAVEGATEAARAAADIVFLEPGLTPIIDAIRTSRQIFHRMYAYVIYRIALSIHLEIFLGLWIAILDRSLNIVLVVFIAIFADVATLAIAYDNAPFAREPVKWNLPRLWGMSVILGLILAAGTWITLTTVIAGSGGESLVQDSSAGIVQNFGQTDAVVFLEIALSQNWLIFITRADGPFWTSLPSWQLCVAVLLVDLVATLFCVFGWFVDHQTSIVAVVRIWAFSFGVFCVCSLVYYILQNSTVFNSVVHWRSPKKSAKTIEAERAQEDLGAEVARVATQHEKNDRAEKEAVVEQH